MALNPKIRGVNVFIGKSYKGNSLKAKIKRNVSLVWGMAMLSFREFKHDDAVFLLIPYPLPLKWLFYRIISVKRINLYIVMVDLDKARYKKFRDKLEKKICNKAQGIIAQTELMKSEMVKRGYVCKQCRNKICVSSFWPVLTSLQQIGKSTFGYSIAFSGALHKAPFVKKISALDERLQFTINPKFRMIEEDWGLVWDGESIDTCSGRYGNYMRMVYPYKASIYLASNRPLIVWKGSGIADYVLENHLGVVVESLYDIYEAIQNLTNNDKMLISQNVCKFSNIIRSGSEFLKLINLLTKSTL